MTNSYQQGLAAFGDDTPLREGDYERLDAVDAGTCALFDTGDDKYLFLVTGTWNPSNERCVSIQSHVYNILTHYGDDSTTLYVVDKDRRSPRVCQFQLGDFDPTRCRVLPPRENVDSITHDQHTVPLACSRAVYHEMNDQQREFLRSLEVCRFG